MPQAAAHASRLKSNLKQVERLFEIHSEIAGSGPGRKVGVEVLNKSAVVLLVACWEAFLEDLGDAAFEEMLEANETPSAIPVKVRIAASQSLRQSDDPRRVWDLADGGWRDVLRDYKKGLLKDFHNPGPFKIDVLFKKLLDLDGLSSSWDWGYGSAEGNKRKLEALLELRHGIAHRVSARRSIRKGDVQTDLVRNLARSSHRAVNWHLREVTGSAPWVQW